MTDPFFSIIIPTYNRPERLAACLGALSSQTFPAADFEVVVVDDGGKFPLDPVVSPYLESLNLTPIRQENQGPAAARNTGAARAKGRYLAFTDDDCSPEQDWLQRMERAFKTRPDHMVGGRTLNSLKDNPFAEASQVLISYLYAYYNTDRPGGAFFASNNFALPRKGFLAVGGFDPNFPNAAAEDRDFCDRWQAAGHGMAYDQDVVMNHSHGMDLGEFWRQHFNYGRGAAVFHRMRARRSGRSLELESLAFYTRLLAYPLVQGHTRPVTTLLLLGLSQLANALGFFSSMARQKF